MNPLFQPEIRAFVAVELPAKNLDGLAYLVSALAREKLSSLQLIKPDNAHLTLKFLGQVPVSRLEDIGKALDQVALNAAPFQIEFGELGGFPNNETPQVLWAGLNDTDGIIQRLAYAVEDALTPLGFPPDTRRFKAHITLARLKKNSTGAERRSAGNCLKRLLGLELETLFVKEISLIQSVLHPKSVRYIRLHRTMLGTSEMRADLQTGASD